MFGHSLTGRTAVYGPVCTVVWEGWSREASPYRQLEGGSPLDNLMEVKS